MQMGKSNNEDILGYIPEVYKCMGDMDRLGEGGFGSLIKITGRKTLALKVMELRNGKMLKIAQDEMDIMAILNTTSASVKMLDHRIENNRAFILMEYQTTLSDYIRESNPTKKEILKVLISLCESVKEIHETGILHLDIQPRNIYINDEGKAIVGDFGTSMLIKDAGENKSVMGTLSYMPPEMRENGKCGVETDIYCIGMLIYALFNNLYLPFMDEFEKKDADTKRLNGEKFPELKNSDIMDVIRDACAFNPEYRIHDADELIKRLNAIYAADNSDLSEPVINNANNSSRDRVYDADEVAYSFAAETTYMPDLADMFDSPNVAKTECLIQDINSWFPVNGLLAANALSEGAGQVRTISKLALSKALENSGMVFDADEVASTSVVFDPGQKKEIRNDSVNFSALSSSEFVKGEYTDIDIVLYEEEYRSVVDDLILKHEGDVKEKKDGPQKIRRHTRVMAVLSSPDIEIDEDSVEKIWEGGYLVFNFVVKIPEKLKAKQIKFTVNISVDGVALTRLSVSGDVVKKSTQNTKNFLSRIKLPVKRHDIKSAFISYASEDRSTVASTIQGMKAVRQDLDIFFDVENIRTGANWEEVILEKLKLSDILYLFWSKNAAASEWVDKEWRYMYRHKGEDTIHPIPLDRPEDCPHPKELNRKHFNDILLYITKE